MEDLLPAEVSDTLRRRFGAEFDAMSPGQRVVLSAAMVETTISHARAMSLCDIHSVDMTKLLSGLVQRGCLAKDGHGRGTRYHIPGSPPATPIAAFANGRHSLLSTLSIEPSDLAPQPSDLGRKDPEALHLPATEAGPVLFGRPWVTSLASPLRAELASLAREAEGGRAARERMEGVIAPLCRGRYLTPRALAQLLDRSEAYIRQGYLNPMVRSGTLALVFARAPNDPRQAYTASASGPDPTPRG